MITDVTSNTRVIAFLSVVLHYIEGGICSDNRGLKSRPDYHYVCLGGLISKALKRSRCLFEISLTLVFFSPR